MRSNMLMQSRHRALRILTAFLVVITMPLASACAQSSPQLDAGQAAFNESKFAQALEAFDKEVDASPTSGIAHFWRAKSLAALGRDKEALAEYKLALLLGGDDAMKAECQAQLKRQNTSVPSKTVADAEKEKLFKLSSKKLDWNVQIDESVKNTIKAQDAQLAALANQTIRSIRGGTEDGGFALTNEIDNALHNGPAHTFAIGAADATLLKSADVYIILDHSGSMNATDCPNNLLEPHRRIQWCIEELNGFATQIAAAMPHGFTFITFDTRPDVYNIRSSMQFSKILDGIKAGGGTSLAPALQQAFRLHTAHSNQPMVIAVVTDGEIDVADVKREIASETWHNPLPTGLFVTFMQIGIAAEKRLDAADTKVLKPYPPTGEGPSLVALNNLTQVGAAYNAVSTIRFSRLRREGLGKDILQNLRLHLEALKKKAPSTVAPSKPK